MGRFNGRRASDPIDDDAEDDDSVVSGGAPGGDQGGDNEDDTDDPGYGDGDNEDDEDESDAPPTRRGQIRKGADANSGAPGGKNVAFVNTGDFLQSLNGVISKAVRSEVRKCLTEEIGENLGESLDTEAITAAVRKAVKDSVRGIVEEVVEEQIAPVTRMVKSLCGSHDEFITHFDDEMENFSENQQAIAKGLVEQQAVIAKGLQAPSAPVTPTAEVQNTQPVAGASAPAAAAAGVDPVGGLLQKGLGGAAGVALASAGDVSEFGSLVGQAEELQTKLQEAGIAKAISGLGDVYLLNNPAAPPAYLVAQLREGVTDAKAALAAHAAG